MLGFDDGAAARLLIAATAIPRRGRARWLQRIAELAQSESARVRRYVGNRG
jgi:hypothetical protein